MINLNHIETLAVAFSSAYKNQAECSWYNAPGPDPALSLEQLVEWTKTHLQAQNLYTKLDNLHRICIDFAAGHFQTYIDEHSQHEQRQPEVDREPFDPVNELHYCFSFMLADGLPRQIEQYSELLAMTRDFTALSEARRPYYFEVADKTGYRSIVSEEELPDETRLQLVTEQQIRDVEIEFCLDSYNEFYRQAITLLEACTAQQGDVQTLAQEILQLFKS